MKNTLPLVLFLLFFPLLAHAAGALDEANNIRSGMSKPDGSAGYIQNQYLNSSGAGGGPIDQPASGSGISGNNPNQTNGVTIDAVAAQNPNQIDDGRDLLQAEQDLKASRERSLISYCQTVVAVYLAMLVVWNILKLAYPPAAAIFAAVATIALVTLVIMGFTKIFKNYPDGINPSSGVKTVCSIMLGGALAACFIGGVVGFLSFMAMGFAAIQGFSMKPKDVISQSRSSKQPETAENILKRAEQYKNPAGE